MPSKQTRFIKYLAKHGSSATAVRYTAGTECGCMTFRPGAKNYSAEWHELNPSEPECNNGYLSPTTTSTSIMALFQNDIQSISVLIGEPLKESIGELPKADLVMFGQIDSNYDFFSLTGFDEARGDYITFNSVNYLIRLTREIFFENKIGEVSLLKRIDT